MIPRLLEPRLRDLAGKFPVVTLTGPRQSGKTTLCRAVFPDKPYVSLEAPDVREFAYSDPRGFLGEYAGGAIMDEVQRVPELLSYIQTMVDEAPTPGRFVLTGSANFALLQTLGQSLAGRTALLELLPLSLGEIRRFPDYPTDLWDLIWRGSYPALYDRRLDPGDWYPSYVATYVERDVRAILSVENLSAFQTFLRLAAGRVAQLINTSSLGADAGINHGTARSWLSVLEAGYVTWRLPPFHSNFSKRLIKTPKLHFVDTGLACYLLGIQSPTQLRSHPLRGPLFETWVASEVLKSRVHQGLPPSLTFFRDRKGLEVDLIVEAAGTRLAVEAKSGSTIAGDSFEALDAFRARMATVPVDGELRSVIVYGGDIRQNRSNGTAVPWSELDQIRWDSSPVF